MDNSQHISYYCPVKVDPKARIGIQDLAAAAGVSKTSVSHAMNGKGRLSDSTRARIIETALELGYQPNASARNLVGGKTGLLGISVSGIESVPFGLSDFDYFIQLLSTATMTALNHGLALVVVGPDRGRTTFEHIEIDGAIVVDPVIDDPLVAEMRLRRLPVVTTGRVPSENGTVEEDEQFWVDNDHNSGTWSILDHLAERGARRIALVTSKPVVSYTADAIRGYKKWCSEHNSEPLISIVSRALNEGAGFAAAVSLLNQPDPPDAIYATIDRLALGVLLAARACEITVPNQLLIAGCTDSPAGEWAQPSLTALALNPEKLGHQAVEMLISLVDGNDPEPRHRIVPTQVVERDSTARQTPVR